jgi:3-hydroxyacyl-CoA dehydrogenase
MRAGFGWDKGPFEFWDMIGLENTVDLFAAEGLSVATWVSEMLAAGHNTFYKVENGVRKYYDARTKSYQPIPGTEELVMLDNVRENQTVWSNSESALIDLGDGVLNLEFRSKMNTIGEGVLKGINHALDFVEKNGYQGLVIGNEAASFSVGANLAIMAMLAFEQEWDELNLAVKFFQDTAMRLRTSPFPVVSAPQGMALGGGCEYSMHADRIVASAETYIGLVEVGVGLIPAGGGTKEFTLRASDTYSKPGAVGVSVLQEYLMNIATAKVSTSAEEARSMNILLPQDRIVMNLNRRLKEAKEMVIELVEEGYTAPSPRKDIQVLGQNALSTLYAGIAGMQYGHYASEHDAKIARKIAYVMTGGDLSGDNNLVSEQYLLDLEREAFLSLLGEKKTLERIQHTLKTGKPLRN